MLCLLPVPESRLQGPGDGWMGTIDKNKAHEKRLGKFSGGLHRPLNSDDPQSIVVMSME